MFWDTVMGHRLAETLIRLGNDDELVQAVKEIAKELKRYNDSMLVHEDPNAITLTEILKENPFKLKKE